MSLLEDVIKSIEEPKLNKLYKYKNLKYKSKPRVFKYDGHYLNIELPKDSVIAGGYVVNTILGIQHKDIDIDIFLYGELDYHERIQRFIDANSRHHVLRTDNIIEIKMEVRKHYQWKRVQLILTYNKSILEILNKFDLYASQVAMDERGTYMTRRGKLALRNKINIFDPMMFNKAYINRLLKYQEKGIKIIMPNGRARPLTRSNGSHSSMYTKTINMSLRPFGIGLTT
jgi:hypothetical protein